MTDTPKDIGLVVDGVIAMVWLDSSIEAVLPTLPEGEHDLVEFGPGAVRCGMLFDGEALSEPPAPPTPPRRISKTLVVERLIAADKAAAFMTALAANPAFNLSWITPAPLGVPVDDADLLAVLDTIDADASEILAA